MSSYPENRRKRNPEPRHHLRQVAPYLGLGFQLAVPVALGLFLGYWLDKKLGSSPLFLLLGFFSGAVAGFFNLYRSVYPSSKNRKKGNCC